MDHLKKGDPVPYNGVMLTREEADIFAGLIEAALEQDSRTQEIKSVQDLAAEVIT